MVPIKPVEMGLELFWEGVKESTWRERYDATVFFIITIPLGIVGMLFEWALEKVTGPKLPEHWLDEQNGIVHTPKEFTYGPGNKH